MKKQRLDKFISNQLLISRNTVRIGVRQGKAIVDGTILRDPSAQISISSEVVFDGQPVCFKEFLYILMYKPKGVICATEDNTHKTVLDLLPQNVRRSSLAPVGRLDKDTTGLLLITDDGAFAHECISPKNKVPKSYIAVLDGDIIEDMITIFRDGVILADGQRCRPAELQRISEGRARIIITEGKYHQIKRMFGTVGLGVNELHRESIGNLRIPENMNPGEWIEIPKEVIQTSIKR